jgi:hypothetical protein
MNQALEYLDIVIAYVAVLVMATSIVSTLTQIVVTTLKKRRSILITHLVTLLKAIGLSESEAKALADEIVVHPKVHAGSVVRREHLVEILLEKAARTDVVSTALKTKLGVTDPQATLKALRGRVLKLEADYPALADHVRRTQAIVENIIDKDGRALMEGIVKIMSRFDQVCDEMTHDMKTHARRWTLGFSVIVAVVLPLDSIAILRQLATNPAEVQQLVKTAKSLKEAGKEAGIAVPQEDLQEDLKNLQAQLKKQVQQISSPALGIQPLLVFTGDYWRKASSDQNAFRVIGILISIALMNLGAPFWFDALKNLLGLRPALASKETGERTERATTQAV